MEYILLIVGLVVGSVACWLLIRHQGAATLATVQAADEKRIEELKRQQQQQLSEMKTQQTQQLSELKTQQQQQINELKNLYEQRIRELKAQQQQQLETQKAQQLQQMEALKEQQQEQLGQQLQLVREQMNSASERILKERSEQLSATNKEQLASILNPLQSNIQQMREAVEKTGKETGTTMERLDAAIKLSLEQSREVGERADKLAQALTSDNKTQGNFGEVRLKQMLEEMGLEEGVQFEEQATLRDKDGRVIFEEEKGHKMIPDIILHFPDKRDVIIDSKMSFTAFERYHTAESEKDKQEALQQHISSMRSHFMELSRKNYAKYIKAENSKLDFVLMYVFSESALQLALSNDPTLWKEAYDRGVIITGSQNLYVLLRVLEMTWKQVRQVENQQRIMECANTIIDRVQMFAERFDLAQQQLCKTQQAFDTLASITADSGTSIITSARQMVKMGAKENPKRKKALPVLGEDDKPTLENAGRQELKETGEPDSNKQ